MRVKKTGILLIAGGHPYFARMAYNMLASIRYHDREIPVAIAVWGEGFDMLDDSAKEQFTHVIHIPMDPDPYRVKLDLDKFSPFDRTLYLDVDMIFGPNKTPNELMGVLSGHSFQCIVRERKPTNTGEYNQWIQLADLETEYGFNEVYDISSEVIYFEGKPSIFKAARKVYKNPKVSIKPFGKGLPDEAFYTIGLELEKTQLPMMPFEPSYWQPRYYQKIHSRQYIQDNFYLLSVGGSHNMQQIKNIYDSLIDMYFYQTGLPGTPFRLQQKSRIFNERRLI